MKVLLILLAISQITKGEIPKKEIDHFVKLITNFYKNASVYKSPTSAQQYYSDGERELYGAYDFVIVGGGAAGSVIASRLSEVQDWSVLLLEAGHYGNEISDIPAMYTAIEFSDFNWAFNSIPQKTSCLGLVNHVCQYPRGKGVGGSSLINGLMYVRGHKTDYDKWEKLVGDKKWGYNSVLKYFKKSENFVHNNPNAPFEPAFHGTGGPLRVEYHRDNSPQTNAFFEANIELGYNLADYNANKLGVSPIQFNMIHGKRLDDGKAFLLSAKKRKNLKILSEAYVTKIRFHGKVATGVEFSLKNKSYFVKAKREVILTAGALGTLQILMLSGVGPKKHLETLKIEVVADLEVGSALRDHAIFMMFVGTNYTEPNKPLKDYVKEYLNGQGLLTLPGNYQGLGFYESSFTNGTGIPEIELIFTPANAMDKLIKRYPFTDEIFEDLMKNVNVSQACIISLIGLYPKSVGTVRLKSKNPYEYPLINLELNSDPDNFDISTLYDGIQLVLKLLQTKTFKAMDAKLQGRPLRACSKHQYLSREYWHCAIRQITVNLDHLLGTCVMGTDPKKGAVVDSNLKVFGLENLRIGDASVFPVLMAGHTHAGTVMIAEQLSDIIKNNS